MADGLKTVLSVIATTGENIKNLSIKNGQLIFIHDRSKLALDYNGKRKFYNQIELLETESERQALLYPATQTFYFVIGTSVLWFYEKDWIQITTPPKDVIFIGTTFPELGNENTLYINKEDGISIWDTNLQSYVLVADKTTEITSEDIDAMFT